MGAGMDGSNFGVAGEELRQFIERVEQLEAEKKALSDDIKEAYSEMKGRGYMVMPVRSIIKERRRNPDDVAEEQAILSLYRAALGMG